MTTKLTCIISLVIRKKYVFKKTRIHYILNRMNKTKKKKKLPKGDECIKHLKFISVTVWSVNL